MDAIAAFVRDVGRQISDWERKSDEVDSLIIKHSCIGGAAGLMLFPAIDNIIMLGNQMLMYRNINSVLGVSLAKDTLKVLGVFMLSQAAGMVSVFGLALAGKFLGGLLKATLVCAPVAMVIDGAVNAGITYVLGVVYARALVGIIKDGKQPTEAGLKEAMRRAFQDKDEIRRIYEEGRAAIRGKNFSEYKKDAEDAKHHAES